MALQKTYDLKGLEVANAYHVVSDVRYNKLYNNVRFELKTYVSSGSKDNEPEDFIAAQTHTFFPTGSYDVVGNDISSACYTFLKTQDTWSGSVDV
jgi:hypothetical protein